MWHDLVLKIHRAVHSVHAPTHAVYFLAVACEAHGLYGYVAAVLFVISLFDLSEGRGA